MESKDSKKIVREGETSGAQAGGPSLQENVSFVECNQPLVLTGRPPSGDLTGITRPQALPRHQTGGAPLSHQTGRAPARDQHGGAPSRHQTDGASPRDQHGGAPSRHQVDGASRSHQPGRVALGHEIVGEGETSGARAGGPSPEEYAALLADLQSEDRCFGINIDPIRPVFDEIIIIPPIHDPDETHGNAPSHQTGGTSQNLGVPTAHLTGGPPSRDVTGITRPEALPRNQTGGAPASDQHDGAPLRHQTDGAPQSNQTGGVVDGDQIGEFQLYNKSGVDLDPHHQTAGTQNLGLTASQQAGGAPPRNQTGGAPSRHQIGGAPPRDQTGGAPRRNQTGEATELRQINAYGVDLDPHQALHAVEPVRRIDNLDETPLVANQTHGVAPHQTGGSSTLGVSGGHQTGGTNQNHGVQETRNQRARRVVVMSKVPSYIRQKYNPEDYDPLVASFGPYNEALHDAPDQRLALVQAFKRKALEWFVTGSGKDANFWVYKVLYLVPDLRRCYTPESLANDNNAELTQLFLQDASLAILIMGVANQEQEDINLLYSHLGAATVVTIIRDSFLLENQLPFWFIRDLLHSRFGVFKGEERWKKHFIALCHGSAKSRNDTPTTTPTTVFWDEEAGEPAHFVEALKIAHLSGWKSENIQLKHRAPEEEERIVLFKDYYAIHSVTELKAKGINVQPNSTNSFKNITFQSNYLSGTLQFPVDFVNYSTKAAYSNIIAYEMTPGNHTQDYTMTAYVHLMKSLLQSPKDVEELQANGIIINMLGSNEQVMNLYRDIYTFGTNCSSKYGEICQKMEDHYNNKTKTWLAEFLYTYFRSPWTVLALFGSIFVVVLTFIQAYYAASEANKKGDKGKSD